MSTFCIPKELSKKFVSAIRSGKINPDALAKMTTEQRRAYLNDYFGEKTEGLNKMIENDLLNKNKGSYVTDDEIKAVTEASKKVIDAREKVTEDMPNGSKERLEYGRARYQFKKLVGDLKTSNKTIKYYLKDPKAALRDTGGAIKSVLTSLDNSFFGRQGLKTLFTNPDIWSKAFIKSWGDIGKELAGKDAMEAIEADVLSRKNAMNGNYKRGKFAVGVDSEEAYPSSLPERIPLLGRAFKASESAFNGAALRMRADLADRVLERAEKQGVDLDDPKQIESLGKLVNSLTGRGSLGKESNSTAGSLLFSVKFLKSNFDTLTAHRLDGDMSSYAKAQATKNLVKVVSGIASILTIANALQPGSVETDPHSSDFGKIKIGDTRFDVTAGMSSLVVLATRVAPLLIGKDSYTKSTTSGKKSKLNLGTFGSQTGLDVVEEFFENKASPLAGVVRDMLKGQDYNDQKPTPTSLLGDVSIPMPIQDFQDLMNDPKSADALAAMIADELGISISTYGKKKK